MTKFRTALSLLLVLAPIGCGEAIDAADLIKKLTEINERTCACKDVACVETASKDRSLLEDSVHRVKKDSELLSKFSELQVKHNDCVVQAMAAQGYK